MPDAHTAFSPLLPFAPGGILGVLQRRIKRFIIEFSYNGKRCLAHTNNSGSMLGLTRPGNPILVTPAPGNNRKLPYTLEMIFLPERNAPPANNKEARLFHASALPPGFWVGVNTLVPNRLLATALATGRVPWATGYTMYKAELKRGQSRLDAFLSGPDLPPLWVECKNVTLVEDGVAAFPDAVTERGQKHVRELIDTVEKGGRAVLFYCIQRADARCFAPADYIDPVYARLHRQALAAGVEIRPHLATLSPAGIDFGTTLPLAPNS